MAPNLATIYNLWPNEEISMNVFSNYIQNKWVTIDGKEPPWMNDEIEN